MSNTSDRSPIKKSLLQVVPIDPMVKDIYRPRNVCQVGNYNIHTHLLLWLFIVNSLDQRFSYVWSDAPDHLAFAMLTNPLSSRLYCTALCNYVISPSVKYLSDRKIACPIDPIDPSDHRTA